MKYRILKEEKGFRAQVQLESRRSGKYFEYIEEHGNINSCPRTHYYDSEQDAIDACKEHHVKMGYDKLPKVVDEFELN